MAWRPAAGPRRRLRRHDNARPLGKSRLHGCAEIGLAGNFALLQAQHRLEQACEPTDGLQMPNVRLDRPYITWSDTIALAGKYSGECVQLGFVTAVGACTMRLDEADRGLIDACRHVGGADQFDLALAVRCK